MMKIINTLLEYIFPKDEAVKILEEGNLLEICTLSKKRNSIFKYKDELVKVLIREIKYKKNMILIRKVASIMYLRLLEYGSLTIVPVPASKKRLRDYGYCQTTLLVKEIEKLDKEKRFIYMYGAITRVKKNNYQNKIKGKEKRLANVSGVFMLSKEISGNVLMIDDVYTTGATIDSIQSAFQREIGYLTISS